MKPKLKQAMDKACRALQAAGIQFDQVDDYQLKVGSWSFYPTKGTIFRDEDDRKDPRSGLAAFIAILRQHHLRPQRPALKPSSPRLVSANGSARSSKSRPEHIKLGGGEFMWEPAELPIKEIIINLSPEPAPDSSEPLIINIGGSESMSQPAEPETILTLSPEPAPASSEPPVQEVKLNPLVVSVPPPKKQPEPPATPEDDMVRMRHVLELQRQRQSNRAERGGS